MADRTRTIPERPIASTATSAPGRGSRIAVEKPMSWAETRTSSSPFLAAPSTVQLRTAVAPFQLTCTTVEVPDPASTTAGLVVGAADHE